MTDFEDNEYLGVVIGQFPRTPVGRAARAKQKDASSDADIFADESDETSAGVRTLSGELAETCDRSLSAWPQIYGRVTVLMGGRVYIFIL